MIGLAILWLAPTIAAFVADIEALARPGLVIFGFDAVVPIFPSESLLTTASNLAAQPGSSIELWRVILAGALGAIVGDSLLYWLSRTLLRRSMTDRVAKASENPKAARALEVLGGTAPVLIVFGRFVPGLRFIVGATMGLSRYPYPFDSGTSIDITVRIGATWLERCGGSDQGDRRQADESGVDLVRGAEHDVADLGDDRDPLRRCRTPRDGEHPDRFDVASPRLRDPCRVAGRRSTRCGDRVDGI